MRWRIISKGTNEAEYAVARNGLQPREIGDVRAEIMNKACPVIIRESASAKTLLAFLHPIAGKQLVKGSVESGECIAAACERELLEESGVQATARGFIGKWESEFEGQVWGFCLMQPESELADTWEHFTQDDGGRLFKFFWQPLTAELGSEWHPLFVRAIEYLRTALTRPLETNDAGAS